MLSESARMSSASEARYRVQAPNSTPRTVKVIALDPQGETVVRRLSETPWAHAGFLTAASLSDESGRPADGWLRDMAGTSRDLIEEVAAADLVLMVATPGGRARAAALVGEACSQRRVMTTALVASADGSDEEGLSRTLAQIRPWSLMTVIANVDDYIDDMLMALRAR